MKQGNKRLDPGLKWISRNNVDGLRDEEMFEVSAGLHNQKAYGAFVVSSNRTESELSRGRDAYNHAMDLRRLWLRKGLEARRRLPALAQGAGRLGGRGPKGRVHFMDHETWRCA